MIDSNSRRAVPVGLHRRPPAGAFPAALHYILGFSLVIAAAVFTLLHHFMTP